MEAEILSEIRDSEKKAEEIMERAKHEKERILHEARISYSKLLESTENEIKKQHEKKLAEFKQKFMAITNEKLAEGKTVAKQLKIKAENNISKAVDFVLKIFEELI